MELGTIICIGLMVIGTMLGTILSYKKRIPPKLYAVVPIVAINLLCEIIGVICKKAFHNNLPSYFFFDPIQALAVAFFIYANVIDVSSKKQVKGLCITLLIAFIPFIFWFFSGDINTMVNALAYTDAFTSVMIVLFCIIYLKDVFSQINVSGQFDKGVITLVGITCVFYAFDAINQLATLYLMNYAVSHHVSVYEVLKEPYISKFSFCQQLFKLRPFITDTNFVFYMVIIIVLGRYLFKNKLQIAVS